MFKQKSIFFIVIFSILITAQGNAFADSTTFSYPLKSREVIHKFIQPRDAYSAGHRGVDFKANLGEPIHAVAPGRVIFSGQVASSFHITVDHGSKIVSTYTYVSKRYVKVGDVVSAGELIGNVGVPQAHDKNLFHFSMRVNGVYVDPLLYINEKVPIPNIHLAPLPREAHSYLTKLVKQERSYLEILLGASGEDVVQTYQKFEKSLEQLKESLLEYEEKSKQWTKYQIKQAKKKISRLEKVFVRDAKNAIKEATKLAKELKRGYEKALKYGVEAAKIYIKQNAKAIAFITQMNLALHAGS